MPKPIDIKKSVYALAVRDGAEAELTLYGDIVESKPVDWWTGEPIEGTFIALDEFLDDLKAIEGVARLTIRMNSYGGDAIVADVIHNRLREMQRAGTETTCIVDGVAMSGGSLIMCACDNVEVNPSSLIMIHNAWQFMFGGYNVDDLMKAAEALDAADRMQAAIYVRKTGLPEAEIRGMMAETTYMTGAEAVEKGFADKLIDDAEPLRIAASADRRTMYVGRRTLHLAPGMTAPDCVATGEAPESAEDCKARMIRKIKR